MPLGTRHRVTGLLLNSRRGFVLEVEGGGAYALDTDRRAHNLVGQRVTVEGTRSGFDRLDVDWIGLAQKPGQLGS